MLELEKAISLLTKNIFENYINSPKIFIMSFYLPIMQYGFLFTTCVLGLSISIEGEGTNSNANTHSNDQNVEIIIIEDKQNNSALVKDDKTSKNYAQTSSSTNPNVYEYSKYVPEEKILHLEKISSYRINWTIEENIENDQIILENRPLIMFRYLEGHEKKLIKLKNSCKSKEEFIKEKNKELLSFTSIIKQLYEEFKADIDSFSQIYNHLITKPRQNCEPQELDNDLSILKTNMQESHRLYLNFFDKTFKIIKTHLEFADAEGLSKIFKKLTYAKARHSKIFEAFKRFMNKCGTSKNY